jgi:hypothetical protein
MESPAQAGLFICGDTHPASIGMGGDMGEPVRRKHRVAGGEREAGARSEAPSRCTWMYAVGRQRSWMRSAVGELEACQGGIDE